MPIPGLFPVELGNGVKDRHVKPPLLGEKRRKFPQVHGSIIPRFEQLVELEKPPQTQPPDGNANKEQTNPHRLRNPAQAALNTEGPGSRVGEADREATPKAPLTLVPPR